MDVLRPFLFEDAPNRNAVTLYIQRRILNEKLVEKNSMGI